MRTLLTSLVVCFGAVLASSAFAGNQYVHDDGAPNASLTYGQAVDYCWFQSFTAIGATDAIRSVEVMWPVGGVPAGADVHVCVWEDPNDDGDPSDAVLVAQQAALVPPATFLTFTSYPLAAPASVHGGFFIGAFVTTDGTFPSIALLDYDTPLTMKSWFTTDAPGFFDPARLSSSLYSRIEMLGAGIHGVFLLRAEGSDAVPTIYCTAKVNSLGCHPQIGFFGTPSVSAGAGFHVYATNVLNRAPGMLIYGTNGHAATPFGGGTLCIAAPIHRTAMQNSGGSLGAPDCSGTYHFDFAAWIASGADPTLVVGTSVHAQFYSRDAGFPAPNTIGLTDALDFTLVP